MRQRAVSNRNFIFVILLVFACFTSINTAWGERYPNVSGNGNLIVHFLDVGQADSILVQLPNGEIMLIDAGNNGDGEFIVSYLKNLSIGKIDYLIGTHPHEDHIGALDDVILNFDIGTLYMPRAENTTKTFEDVLLAVESKGLKINTAKAGVEIFTDSSLNAVFIAPGGNTYEDLNNYSAVVLLTYGETSFLFTGDAEDVSESEMLSGGYDLQADVLKVGHHGSNSSSTEEFLTAVNPAHAIISVGLNNDYGHPTANVLQRLEEHDIIVHRTDLLGTIIAVSDGESINFYSDDTAGYTPSAGTVAAGAQAIAVPATPTPEPVEESISLTVFITKTGEKYHTDGCSYLSKSQISIDLNTAKGRGYTPCSRCNPPR